MHGGWSSQLHGEWEWFIMSHVLNFQLSEMKTETFSVEKIHDNMNLVLYYMS